MNFIFTANDLHFYDGSSTVDIISGDVFFEILDPPELRYSYRIRPAKDFGATFVSNLKNYHNFLLLLNEFIKIWPGNPQVRYNFNDIIIGCEFLN